MCLTQYEVKKMKTVCNIAARTLHHVQSFVRPGITTEELNQIAHDYILKNNAIPSSLNYFGYPKSICTSVNDVACHGVPDKTKLKDGDIVNIDVTVCKDGFYGDCSATFGVGNISESAQCLIAVAETALFEGIMAAKPYGFTGDIGDAVNNYVKKRGYYIVEEIGGHGIGKKLHDYPFVPSFGPKGSGSVLKPWTCIAIEPIVNEGSPDIVEYNIPNSEIKYYKTADGKLSAQFEHTVLITDSGCEILTLL